MTLFIRIVTCLQICFLYCNSLQNNKLRYGNKKSVLTHVNPSTRLLFFASDFPKLFDSKGFRRKTCLWHAVSGRVTEWQIIARNTRIDKFVF